MNEDTRRPLLQGDKTTNAERASSLFSNANLWSKISFCWLNPLFEVGRRKTLELNDVPAVPNEDSSFRSSSTIETALHRQKQLSFSKAIFATIWKSLLVTALFAGLTTITSYMGPLLITMLIDVFAADESASKENPYGYILAFCLFLAKTIESLSQRIWYFGAQKIGVRVRAGLMVLIYRRALAIKGRCNNLGEIVNLMSVDVEKIGDFAWYFHGLWLLPIQISLALFILHINLGFAPSIAALLATIVILVGSTPLANLQERYHSKIMSNKDKRVKATTESLKCMRILKLQSWETLYMEKIFKLRDDEKGWLKRYLYTCAAIAFLFWAAPTLVSVATFKVCILMGTPLTAGKVFAALATFRILQEPIYNLPELLSMVAQTKVLLDRIANFIFEEEGRFFKAEECNNREMVTNVGEIIIREGAFSWELCGEKPLIITSNLHIMNGQKVAVCGSVGSGKSGLLLSMLGETHRVSGSAVRVCGSRAYVPQSAWIQTGTIKDNILFGRERDEMWFPALLRACALERDIRSFANGDLTMVGERGINLSGGQKQRIQLARALYSNADVFLLDDPFSAVDSHTGAHLVKECLKGLLAEKTVVYVTHQMELLSSADVVLVIGAMSEPSKLSLDKMSLDKNVYCVFVGLNPGIYKSWIECNNQVMGYANAIYCGFYNMMNAQIAYSNFIEEKGWCNEVGVHLCNVCSSGMDIKVSNCRSTIGNHFFQCTNNVMREGKIVQSGKYLDLVRDESGELFRLMKAHNQTLRNAGMDATQNGDDGRPPSNISEDQIQLLQVDERKPTKKMVKKISEIACDEEREKGRVKFRVYAAFVKTAYKGALVPLMLFCQISFLALQMASSYWMGWATNPEKNITESRLMTTYVILSVGSAIFVLGRAVLLAMTAMETAQKLFVKMLQSVFRAPISFFDSTPSSRILNRSSTDQSTLDTDIPYRLAGLVFALVQLLSIIVLMSLVSWQAFVVFILIVALCVWYQSYYISTARELARMVSISRAPVLHHTSESLSGAATIRCFSQVEWFFNKNFELVDRYSALVFHNFAAMEWLCLRINFLFNLAFFCVLLALVSLPKEQMDPSLAGLAATYGLNLNVLQAWVLWNLCNVENKMISVERILQFCDIANEAPLVIENCRPEPEWPQKGNIDIIDLYVRYGPHLPLVLHGVNCCFPGQSKVGIVGRTGSGKSTLIQALFRLVEPSAGTIRIDGVDICKIGLHDLRSRMSIIPQDPSLFQGTLRYNLDPLQQHAEVAIWEALDKCHLGDLVRRDRRLLDVPIDEDGENWSLGQRQLLCLARALLKNRKMIVLDEVTASIDTATDRLIQKAIRSTTNHCTVITIAHRLPTVIDSDLVLVLHEGKILEYDSPTQLLKDASSAFSKLIHHGDANGRRERENHRAPS